MSKDPIPYNPNPAIDYGHAAGRITALQAKDGPEVYPGAGTLWLDHGRKVEQAAVLFHGYTSSPKSLIALARCFFELGFNVLAPREPHHGLADRMTADHSQLTAKGLVNFASAAVDIAQGLGERVTVAGLSMGGLLAAWTAQNRADIERAGLISPAFGFQAIPRRLTSLVARLALTLPNFFIWWDSKLKDTPHPPYHSYPRYASRTLGHLLSLSGAVRSQARRSPPKARQVVVITNPCDPSVDNRLTAQILSAWQAAGAQNVSAYEFDRRHNLIHDLIDPEQPQEQVGVVYPILLELLAD